MALGKKTGGRRRGSRNKIPSDKRAAIERASALAELDRQGTSMGHVQINAARHLYEQANQVRAKGEAAQQDEKADQAEQPLTVAERNLLVEFQERKDARHRAPRVRVDHRPPNSVGIRPAEGEPKTAELARLVAFGTTSTDFYARTFQELLDADCRRTETQSLTEADVNGALAAMHGIAPRDETEAMLGVQMVAVHSAAMRSLRLLKGSETVPQQDSNGNLAVRLLRTFTMQMEAMQRYRSRGVQVVKHVHVYQGGQAIVGSVHQGGGARTKNGERAHAHIAHAPGAALPCPDPQRETVPIASGER
jgi:hypothetical protein